MNGYIEAGYTVVLGTLGVYAVTLLRREQLARARLRPHKPPAPEGSPEAPERPSR